MRWNIDQIIALLIVILLAIIDLVIICMYTMYCLIGIPVMLAYIFRE
jgi:hypothetical protein